MKSANGFSCGPFGSDAVVVRDEGLKDVGILCVVPRFAMKALKWKLETGKSNNGSVQKVLLMSN